MCELISYNKIVKNPFNIQQIFYRIGKRYYDVKVRAGSNNFQKGGILMQVIGIRRHPQFSTSTLNNDVALLTTDTFKPYMDKFNIKIILLATKLPADGAQVEVSGYGTLWSGGDLAASLRQVAITKMNFAYCNEQYSWDLTRTMICAGAQYGGKDSCQGDSGGPLTYNGTQVGVVSWGNGCADVEFPGIYTNVPYMKSWIEKTIKDIARVNS